MPQAEMLATILASCESTAKTVAKLDKIICGNGEPEKGIATRLVLLESKTRRATWIIGTLFGALACAGFEFAFSLLRK